LKGLLLRSFSIILMAEVDLVSRKLRQASSSCYPKIVVTSSGSECDGWFERMSVSSHPARTKYSRPQIAVKQSGDNLMAKENRRGNREAKKPKQVKTAAVAAPLFEKGTPAPAGMQKKKKG